MFLFMRRVDNTLTQDKNSTCCIDCEGNIFLRKKTYFYVTDKHYNEEQSVRIARTACHPTVAVRRWLTQVELFLLKSEQQTNKIL
jgi:hypothetical protein